MRRRDEKKKVERLKLFCVCFSVSVRLQLHLIVTVSVSVLYILYVYYIYINLYIYISYILYIYLCRNFIAIFCGLLRVCLVSIYIYMSSSFFFSYRFYVLHCFCFVYICVSETNTFYVCVFTFYICQKWTSENKLLKKTYLYYLYKLSCFNVNSTSSSLLLVSIYHISYIAFLNWFSTKLWLVSFLRFFLLKFILYNNNNNYFVKKTPLTYLHILLSINYNQLYNHNQLINYNYDKAVIIIFIYKQIKGTLINKSFI